MSSKEKLLLLILLAGGIALRLAYLAEIRDNPFFDGPVLDEAVHYRWASQIARGEPWFPDEPFFRAPLYPYFLSLLLRAGRGDLLLPRVVQLLIGATLPLLLYGIGRRLFGRTAAAAGSVILLFYGLAYYFDAGLLIVPILLPLVLLHLGATLRLGERFDRRSGFVAGLFLGLAAVARPNILLFGALAPLLLLVERGGRRTASRWLIPYVAGALLPIAPVFLHNAATGDPVLIAWQGGTNFWIGNNPESDGMTAIAPGTDGTWWGGYADMIRIAEESAGRPLRRSEVSSYWFRRTLGFFREEPGAAGRLLAKKAYLLVNDFEVSNNQGIYFFRRYSKILDRLMDLGFGVLFPLAAAGFVLVRRDRRTRLLFLFLGAYGLSIVLFFVTARFRMPIVVLLPLFAGAALARWVRIPRTGVDRPVILSFAVFAAAALLSNSKPAGLDRDRFAQGHYNVGVVHLTARRFDEAIPHFLAALEEEPAYRNARYNLGLCYSYRDRLEEAEAELGAVVREHPRFAPARPALASVLERRGDRAGALRQAEEGLRLEPNSPELLALRERLLRTPDP